MKRIAITGAGGFIGRRMAERALERGLEVRGLELSPTAVETVRRLGIPCVLGDVNDADAVRTAFEGVDAVFHTAAIVEEDGDPALYRRVNVEGSSTVANVARERRVRTFVHLSSVMVYGFRYPPFVGELGPLSGEGNPYCETKIESEAAVRTVHGETTGVIVIRPGDVYGVGSVPWVHRPLSLLEKRLFALPDGGRGLINPVHVDDLLDGVFLALEQRAVGQTFNLTSGEAPTCSEFFAYHASMLGRRSIPRVPGPLLRAGLAALAAGSRARGERPEAHPAAVDYLSRPHAYGIGHARRALGYAPRVRLRDGMRSIARSLGLREPVDPAEHGARAGALR